MWQKIMAERAGRPGPAVAVPTVCTRKRESPPPTAPGPPASRAPMASADLVFGDDGWVAWDQIWDDFCELALIGGPPHRGAMLVAPDPTTVNDRPDAADRVREELARGLAQTTHWPVRLDVEDGWIGLVCPDEDAAAWMTLAILAENVEARCDGTTLLVPAGPGFTLEGEIKSVVTVVAKSWHFWAKHGIR